MRRSWFERARHFAGRPRGWLGVQLAGASAALLVPLLIILLGLFTELLVNRGLQTFVSRVQYWFWVGSWIRAWFEAWPALDHKLTCLLILIGAGFGLAGLESLTLFALYRCSLQAALSVTCGLKAAIQAQAFRLGAGDLFGPRPCRPEKLFTERAEQVRTGLVAWWRALPSSVVLLVSLVLLALVANVWLTSVAIVLSGLLWMLRAWLERLTVRQKRMWTDRASRQHAMLAERLHQVPLVSGYALSDAAEEPLEGALQRYEAAVLWRDTGHMALTSLEVFFVLGGTATVLLLAGVNILRAVPQFSIPGTVILASSLIGICFPLARLYRLPRQLAHADRAAEEILRYLDRTPSVDQVPHAKRLGTLRENLGLQSVRLVDHHGQMLLDHVTLTISARERVALLSSDLHTPMAVACLLVRFHDPTDGRVLFDGQDVRLVTLESLRQQVALVTRDDLLFTGTVSDNISGGASRSSSLQITDAAKQAGAYDSIQQLPQGFSTIVGQRGIHLDAGQAFRIGLARALMRKPAVLVVQEPSDESDPGGSGCIAETLCRAATDRTLVILPTRLSTLRSVDRILLFHDGKLEATGSHPHLLQSSQLYRHLHYLQSNEFGGVGK